MIFGNFGVIDFLRQGDDLSLNKISPLNCPCLPHKEVTTTFKEADNYIGVTATALLYFSTGKLKPGEYNLVESFNQKEVSQKKSK